MNELTIIYLPIDSLTPYKKNARKHKKSDIETIKNSIGEFGMCDPIGIWGDKNIIIEGHGRLLALKELGYDNVPCIRLDHLTDEQRRAYTLAHNKTAENSEWDFELLSDELDGILDIDMSDFGFDIFDMEDIEEVDSYDENNDDREYFSATLTFPTAQKKQILKYLRKHKKEMIEEIIRKAGE